MTDWEKFLERRKANIGFITRGKAFREPTKFEMDIALQTEIDSWQMSIGKKPFHSGRETYSTPLGAGINLSQTRETGYPLKEVRDKAMKTYIETPMDENGVLASQGINTEIYKWKDIGSIKAFFYWITGRKIKRVKKDD